jgi:hypothetical protein
MKFLLLRLIEWEVNWGASEKDCSKLVLSDGLENCATLAILADYDIFAQKTRGKRKGKPRVER